MVKSTQRPDHVALAAVCSLVAMTAQGMAQTPHVSPQIGSLPRDLTPWGMFVSADIVVKLVIIGLVFASLVTWTITIAKAREIFAARRQLVSNLTTLEAAPSLADVGPLVGGGAALASAGVTEISSAPDAHDTESIKERLASKLSRLEAEFGRAMVRGTGLLATIGATAPFVGLFGTVWGIMTSFIGISKQQTTNLAVVAPGIAEALLATAAGLVVAIPAVVIYNAFSRAIAVNRAQFADASAAVLRLASRDLSANLFRARTGVGLAPSNEGAPTVVRRQRP